MEMRMRSGPSEKKNYQRDRRFWEDPLVRSFFDPDCADAELAERRVPLFHVPLDVGLNLYRELKPDEPPPPRWLVVATYPEIKKMGENARRMHRHGLWFSAIGRMCVLWGRAMASAVLFVAKREAYRRV